MKSRNIVGRAARHLYFCVQVRSLAAKAHGCQLQLAIESSDRRHGEGFYYKDHFTKESWRLVISRRRCAHSFSLLGRLHNGVIILTGRWS